MTIIKSILHSVAHRFGYDVTRYWNSRPCPSCPDLTDEDAAIMRFASTYTMTSQARIYALINAVRYICAYKIPGSLVECGVWRGGSMMAAARTLLECGCVDRDLYLFDTYEGMPKPGPMDKDFMGREGEREFQSKRTGTDSSDFCFAPLEDVRQAMLSTGYPPDRIHFIKGKVEDTIPAQAPMNIALLRLDTDWYESTKHELTHLFPRLSPGGTLIVDDYGHWKGSKKAVDDFFVNQTTPVLLNRIDYSGRIAVRSF